MKRTKRSSHLILLSVLLFSHLACQTKEDLERDRKIFSLQTRILQLEKIFHKENKSTQKTGKTLSLGLAESKVRQEEVWETLQSLKGELQTLRHFTGANELSPESLSSQNLDKRFLSIEKKIENLAEVKEKINTLDKTQNDILKNMENLVKLAASLKKEVKAQLAASLKKEKKKTRTKMSSLASYEKAFKEKRYLHVVEDYSSLSAKTKASNKARFGYLHAESLFKLGRISAAALSFDELLKEKNTGKKTSKIYLRLGDCFRLLGEKKTALIYYEELLEKYPKSKEVNLAKDYLKKLKA